MRKIAFLTAVLALLATFAAADSFTGTINNNQDLIYTFNINKDSQLAIDLIWEERVNHGLFVVLCDLDGLETQAYGIGQNPRGPVSLRMSALGGSACAVAVGTTDATINFIVTIQAVANRALTVSPPSSVASTEGVVASLRRLLEKSREGKEKEQE